MKLTLFPLFLAPLSEASGTSQVIVGDMSILQEEDPTIVLEEDPTIVLEEDEIDLTLEEDITIEVD